jgi:hypothetical protein
MDINDRIAALEARVAALEGKQQSAAPGQRTIIKLYPQSIATAGYATKEGEAFIPFTGSAAGTLTDIQKYSSEYEGKAQTRLVFVIEGQLSIYQINVGASTVFARSLAAGLGELSCYVSLIVGAKPSADKKNVVFAELKQYGELVRSNCKDWSESDVLDVCDKAVSSIRGGLMRLLSSSIESGSLTKERAISKTAEMFNVNSAKDLNLGQLRALIAELRITA